NRDALKMDEIRPESLGYCPWHFLCRHSTDLAEGEWLSLSEFGGASCLPPLARGGASISEREASVLLQKDPAGRGQQRSWPDSGVSLISCARSGRSEKVLDTSREGLCSLSAGGGVSGQGEVMARPGGGHRPRNRSTRGWRLRPMAHHSLIQRRHCRSFP